MATKKTITVTEDVGADLIISEVEFINDEEDETVTIHERKNKDPEDEDSEKVSELE